MCDQCAPPVLAVPTGSRRRRLWDLPHQCHCPVVGVCLPLDTLRNVVNKALGGKAVADDYEVHVGAATECVSRNRLSELLQNELERRYSRKVQEYRAAKTTKAVATLWALAVHQCEIGGAFWAALTHPRCDEVLQEVLLRDMHMIQHQAGAAVRVDVSKFNALLQENLVIGHELGKAQERCTRVLAEKSVEIERLTAQTIQLRSMNLSSNNQIVFLSQNLETIKASIPGFETASRLQKKIEQMAARQSELEAMNAELRQKLSSTMKLVAMPVGQAPIALQADTEELTTLTTSLGTAHLKHKIVLCVGGRNGSVANYRDVIEKVGARFSHHDGGLENNQNILDASLSAADLVICQTGCISHSAYWKVKDFCKRTGKRCVFVENPSVSSLARGLEQIATDSICSNQAQNTSPLSNSVALLTSA